MVTFAWVAFIIAILVLIAIDLASFKKKEEPRSQSILWTLIWVFVALLFNLGIYFFHPAKQEAALQFFTGYLLEKLLSLDNIIVIAAIFQFYSIPVKHQHTVLMYGILGAIFFRVLMITTGVALMQNLPWIHYVFGLFLIFTAIKLFVIHQGPQELAQSKIISVLRVFFRISPTLDEGRFLIVKDGKWLISPLLLALIQIELADIVFAFDSIPAILAITNDTFIVFTSNIFAILGLRSLYFLAAEYLKKVRYLNFGLGLILFFIGIKMLFKHQFEISTVISLGIIVSILGLTFLLSKFTKKTPTVPKEIERVVRFTIREAQKIIVLIVGITTLLIGLAMIFLPGPAIIVIPFGLMILATEFSWARHWLKKIKR
jgi:tellurite resistance protein TerC